jgi:hypothetical protein
VYTDIELVVFLFAKEFGWSLEYVLNMQYRHFRMYLRELVEYYRAQQSASEGKKYTRPVKAQDVAHVDVDLKELARILTEERNARGISNVREGLE